MKILLCAVLVAASSQAFADCKTSLPLQGTVSIKECDQHTGNCIPGAKAAYDYLEKASDDDTVVTIALNASPWRLYDNEGRILSVEELADMARPHITKGAKQIVLIASWTGVAPNSGGKSLAQKLSDSLKGFPVRGMDGFLWIAKNGALRTTRQAFTVRQGGNPYSVVEGDDVMVSLATGWPAEQESTFIDQRNAEGILRAGVGWDLYLLCPDRALQAFDAAARLSHPIAAYNAALMRLERGHKGDREAAIALLTQAVAAGDKKAQARLDQLKREGH
jgi:hypothetical protein